MKSEPSDFGPSPAAGHGSKRAFPSPALPLSAGEGPAGGAQRRYLDIFREHLSTKLKGNILRETITALRACGREREADSVKSCGSIWHVFESACGTKRLFRASCDHPLCPTCQRERSLPLQRKVMHLTRQRDRVFRFITLTVRNVPHLGRGYLDWLIRSFAKLRKGDTWSSRIRGGVYSIETTYNAERGDWHVHVHVIVEAEHSLPQPWIFRLRRDWISATNGAGSVVHMRAVNRRAVRELVKYQAKVVDLVHLPDLIDEYLVAFHNVRRLQCFGTFLGAEIPEPEKKPWKCTCGLCRAGDWVFVADVPDSETVERDGERQLRFDFSPDWSPPAAKLTVEDFLKEYPKARWRKGWLVCA